MSYTLIPMLLGPVSAPYTKLVSIISIIFSVLGVIMCFSAIMKIAYYLVTGHHEYGGFELPSLPKRKPKTKPKPDITLEKVDSKISEKIYEQANNLVEEVKEELRQTDMKLENDAELRVKKAMEEWKEQSNPDAPEDKNISDLESKVNNDGLWDDLYDKCRAMEEEERKKYNQIEEREASIHNHITTADEIHKIYDSIRKDANVEILDKSTSEAIKKYNSIIFECNYCGTTFVINGEYAGTLPPCPNCGGKWTRQTVLKECG